MGCYICSIGAAVLFGIPFPHTDPTSQSSTLRDILFEAAIVLFLLAGAWELRRAKGERRSLLFGFGLLLVSIVVVCIAAAVETQGIN